MARRRLLLFSDGYTYSGAERYLLDLARGLPRDRFRIEAVAASDGAMDVFAEDLARAGAHVTRLPRVPTLAARGAWLRVHRFFLTQRPDILHFNLSDPRACNGAMVAAWAALRRGFVVTEHLPTSRFDDKPLPFRHRLAARHTARTIVNSDHYRSAIQRRHTGHGRTIVVPNGVTDSGPCTLERRLAARGRLGFADASVPLVGWVGRAVPQKNLDLMIEGARRLLPAHPTAQVLIAGEGPDIEPAQRKVAELGLGDRVRFLGHRDDARELMCGLDVLVNTSHYEGMPISVLEAMCASLPTVGSNIPGMSELVADRASGRLFIPGDGDHLGQILIDTVQDPDRLQRMGQVARERMLTLFSLELMCHRTAEIYDDLLAERGL